MNLQRAYALLAMFYTVLLAVGVLAVVMGGGTPLSLLQLAIGAVSVIGLWGYLLGRQVMSWRTWRPFAGVLAIGIAANLWLVFTTSPTSAELTWLLANVIFTSLPALLLFRYGDRDQDLWASPAELEGGRALNALLERRRELQVEKREESSRPASVNVFREGDHYRACVVRGQGDAEERFEQRFRRPATLAGFIETFTCIEVRDFVAKYRDEPDTA
ncbi:hypothetical protein [Halomonas organivorans]|uniref:Membrane protein implicated in regulation of membrane protease activity n=1 Tax=Halomonas organivorans TaxID=257772 RepID=A0A7W5BZE5_9GAMM|nr:hypothetical protein [Halomonas organivorans]MBB3141473.1 membrane protein implicated in regulation of membrane protease activity [Halomonas organivorans]